MICVVVTFYQEKADVFQRANPTTLLFVALIQEGCVEMPFMQLSLNLFLFASLIYVRVLVSLNLRFPTTPCGVDYSVKLFSFAFI